MANKYNVTRNAIWKAVNLLKQDGYNIDSVRNKGYCLLHQNDIISQQGIKKYLRNNLFDIDVYKTIDSTNIRLKQIAVNCKEGKVIVALHQTAGKGRMGRSFFSPHDSGIYLSVLVRPNFSAEQALYLTTAAAVAVAKSIENICGIKADIKWVNDIYCGAKKVCGILTEASFNLENQTIDYAVVGIGVNLFTPKEGFPDELKNIATSVLQNKGEVLDIKCKLIAEILDNFFDYYNGIPNKTFFAEYKARSFIIGKEVSIIQGEKIINAKVIDIDNQCKLLVRYNGEGEIHQISSGEVSIKPVIGSSWA
ncbi:MAG: biotin--[acetyl-CoA-carboxylase] ligase [Oscillospiraceae bacterium]